MPTVHTLDFDCAYADDWFGPPWTTPEVVLVQHGFGRSGEYWRHWVPDLAAEHRVIRRDLRAHGGSSAGDPAHDWTPDTLAEDVVAFLDALGLERVHYVGESVGGITGVVLGARFPERLRTLTLVQTPIRLGQVLQDAMRGPYPDWASALRDLGPGGWVVRNMPADSPDPEVRARVAWERAQWERADADALVRLADATRFVDVADRLAAVAVPTLVLAPACSALTPLADQFALRTTIPDAEIEVFEGRGHTVYQDEPHRCTERIHRFIATRRDA
jgi:pimeloyl-ACP methyl ester carboxylesterase